MEKRWNIIGGLVLAACLVGAAWVWNTRPVGTVVLENGSAEGIQEMAIGTEVAETTPDEPAVVPSPEIEKPTPKAPEEKTGTEKPEEKAAPSPTTAPSKFKVIERRVNFGFGAADRKAKDIDTIVLHSSYNNQGGDRYSVDTVIGIWKSYDVAPHYLVDRKGNAYRLVDESDIAYHAGVSEMKDGRTNVNAFSIGIEILNAEDDDYTDAEYEAIRDLIAELKQTYPIKYVVGHDDIAPGRKTDPWNFDWKHIR
ncbi:MAG: N-acetylmuramoyl-L-alanine amidase [Candidatus Moranbacteria bacterium]|nr:N-acetylmuramoyl-L-alanine amidase [Candidatus Moranbacteria bacterium]MBP6034113.1 N-acetylmuramoyl-L-alanine amidase [Candidatus Moranbacteria bacterium]MBP7695865.1 N-acetylmuramoyl-L-alanine amidase [Candidatus Moranbacteria bacterium]